MLRRRSFLHSLLAIIGDMLLVRSSAAQGQEVSVKALGAIGDGRSHPLSEWIPSRYPDLEALQADYPDARSVQDEIDFVAINKAVRIASARGVIVKIPAGTYRAWIYVHVGNVALVGAGSDVCSIRLPDGASHTVAPEDRGPALTGTPCVIEAGITSAAHRSPALRQLSITGLTLDGNSGATRPPRTTREDVFAWGMAFTNFSEVYYRDIMVQNCHAGGVGTFIVSDHHDGEVRVARCGRALSHPGFDVNSSHDGRWTVTVDDCPYGVRLLDNCWDCVLTATVRGAELAGVVCDNQPVNASYRNLITADVKGGCRNAGVQIGDGCSRSRFVLTVSDVEGIGVNSRGQEDRPRGESDNSFVVITRNCGQQATRIAGAKGNWRITSDRDGARAPAGTVFAVDVLGSGNTLDVSVADDRDRRLRGIILRPAARANVVRFRQRGVLLETYNDQGSANSRLS